jgi:hypothetical protein
MLGMHILLLPIQYFLLVIISILCSCYRYHNHVHFMGLPEIAALIYETTWQIKLLTFSRLIFRLDGDLTQKSVTSCVTSESTNRGIVAKASRPGVAT